MYSLVLMMAVTTGSETAAFGRRHSCHGCSGGCYVSCGGGGCHGSSDCCGGRRGHRRHRCHGCHGCNGGCSSYGGGYGCSGMAVAEKKGDKQALKEMQVFARRIEKQMGNV